MKTTRTLFVLPLALAFVLTAAPVAAEPGWSEPLALADTSAPALAEWDVVRVEPKHDPSIPAADGLPRREPAPTGKPAPQPERVRELPEMRRATARFFELSDGRVQAEVFSTPTFYQDGKGEWRGIDTAVGRADVPGFVLGNETNRFVSLFGDRSDRLARVEFKGRRITLGTAGSPRELAPEADGDTVAFADVFGGELGAADLVYRVASDALKEEIILERAPTAADPAFSFTLRLGGVEARERADGSVYFLRTGAGRGERPLFVIPKPVHDRRGGRRIVAVWEGVQRGRHADGDPARVAGRDHDPAGPGLADQRGPPVPGGDRPDDRDRAHPDSGAGRDDPLGLADDELRVQLAARCRHRWFRCGAQPGEVRRVVAAGGHADRFGAAAGVVRPGVPHERERGGDPGASGDRAVE